MRRESTMFRSRYDQMVIRFVRSVGVEVVPDVAWLHAMQGRTGLRLAQRCGLMMMAWSPWPVVLVAVSASLWLVVAWAVIMLSLLYLSLWLGLLEYRAIVCAAYQYGRSVVATEAYEAGKSDGRRELAAATRAEDARRKAAALKLQPELIED